ncbi:hypothetical protein FPQ18DRAFT_336623 [Pyronema domesticum]|nr:hypothetical protein FPQ18DRAFT_336623 [Pyronema domesticum]
MGSASFLLLEHQSQACVYYYCLSFSLSLLLLLSHSVSCAYKSRCHESISLISFALGSKGFAILGTPSAATAE